MSERIYDRLSVTLRRISVAEAFSNPMFPALCREYAHESALAGLPEPQEKLSAYQALEAGGSEAFCVYGAFMGDLLIGFLALLTPLLPHYGQAVAVAESLFVARAYRKTGAGMLLIRRAEKRAREVNSPGLLFSAPAKGRLARLLPRLGYGETNRVFLKEFEHARSDLP
ncbi:MAG: GNAT family N-acetyltransferase [Deltaproteobacteria bacterium]|jgi:GNAT superfamily N-acetyltransferase|nr:GNAT family N-acetyltransferase [Deltaproteobacteria bacterium]